MEWIPDQGIYNPDDEDAGIKNPEKYMKDTLCFRQTESVLFSIKHEENKKGEHCICHIENAGGCLREQSMKLV